MSTFFEDCVEYGFSVAMGRAPSTVEDVVFWLVVVALLLGSYILFDQCVMYTLERVAEIFADASHREDDNA